MAINDRVEQNMTDKKTSTRVALIEQTQTYTQQTLERIERKLESLDKKIDRVESKVYANLKWVIGLSVPTLITIVGLGIEMYQFVKQN